jgi:DNA-binding NarL/FixJ family response regulator/DNA-binding SARP family transcriptional activator
VEFRILGPLEVVEDGNPLALGTVKERLVLAVLLLHPNEFVSRERLIDDLWGEAPPPTAQKAVNVYLSKLRKALTGSGIDPIMTAPGGYLLKVDPERLDSSRMQILAGAGREFMAEGELEKAAERFREALLLWRGPTLAGLQLESRGRDEVAQLDELHLTLQMDRIDCDIALGREEEAVRDLNLLVREHPLRERLRGQQMLALYRSGRQAEALEAYADARKTLVDDLGIEPSEALQRLQQAILRQEPSLERPEGTTPLGGLLATAVAARPRTRVVLAEDHYLLREGLSRLLETNTDLEIAALCKDFDSLRAAVEAERPDVVVTDIRMPPGNLDEGIRASDWLRHEHPDVGVVVLSQYVEPAYALALFEAGTERRAYLLKEHVRDVDQLVAAIRAVAEGGSVVDPRVVEALVTEKTRRERSRLDELTQRERDVLSEMAEGKNNAGIAEALGLSERTVEKAIHAIFLKLGLAWETAVHKRVKAVIFYLSGIAAETHSAEKSS